MTMVSTEELGESERMSVLQTDLEELNNKIAVVASDLEDLREKRACMTTQYSVQEDDLFRKINKLDQRWIKRRSAFKLHQYSEVIKDVADNDKHLIPTMVLSKQANLVQSLHQMELADQDRDRCKAQNIIIMRLLKQQIGEEQKKKMNVELDYMNKICGAEQSLFSIRTKYEDLTGIELGVAESTSTACGSDVTEDEEEVAHQQPMQDLSTSSWSIRSMFRRSSDSVKQRVRARSYSDSSTIETVTPKKSTASSMFTAPPPSEADYKSYDRQRIVQMVTTA